ncbi:MAG: hypothetical protein AAFO06_16460 [Cyanobacteria bacterium J06597_16]
MTSSLTPLAKLAEQVLKDPALMRKLSDRVYALLKTEIQTQQDRLGIARRR